MFSCSRNAQVTFAEKETMQSKIFSFQKILIPTYHLTRQTVLLWIGPQHLCMEQILCTGLPTKDETVETTGNYWNSWNIIMSSALNIVI